MAPVTRPVAALQTLLSGLGYDVGTANGSINDKTRAALAQLAQDPSKREKLAEAAQLIEAVRGSGVPLSRATNASFDAVVTASQAAPAAAAPAAPAPAAPAAQAETPAAAPAATPVPAQAAAATPAQRSTEYRVERGDTVGRIAEAWRRANPESTLSQSQVQNAIIERNNIRDRSGRDCRGNRAQYAHIEVGQTLQVPEGNAIGAVERVAQVCEAPARPQAPAVPTPPARPEPQVSTRPRPEAPVTPRPRAETPTPPARPQPPRRADVCDGVLTERERASLRQIGELYPTEQRDIHRGSRIARVGEGDARVTISRDNRYNYLTVHENGQTREVRPGNRDYDRYNGLLQQHGRDQAPLRSDLGALTIGTATEAERARLRARELIGPRAACISINDRGSNGGNGGPGGGGGGGGGCCGGGPGGPGGGGASLDPLLMRPDVREQLNLQGVTVTANAEQATPQALPDARPANGRDTQIG